MIATMAYNYAKGRWQCFSVADADNIVMEPEQIKRRLTDLGNYLYPVIFKVKLKSFEYRDGHYSAEFFDDAEFPEVFTLEQSIERNKKVLRGWSI